LQYDDATLGACDMCAQFAQQLPDRACVAAGEPNKGHTRPGVTRDARYDRSPARQFRYAGEHVRQGGGQVRELEAHVVAHPRVRPRTTPQRVLRAVVKCARGAVRAQQALRRRGLRRDARLDALEQDG